MEIRVVGSGLTVVELGAFLEQTLPGSVQRCEQRSQPALRGDSAIISALMNGGAVIVAALVSSLLTHILAKRADHARNSLRQLAPARIHVVIIKGGKVTLEHRIRYAANSDLPLLEKELSEKLLEADCDGDDIEVDIEVVE